MIGVGSAASTQPDFYLVLGRVGIAPIRRAFSQHGQECDGITQYIIWGRQCRHQSDRCYFDDVSDSNHFSGITKDELERNVSIIISMNIFG